MDLLKVLNDEGVSEVAAADYKVRKAVRGVLFDGQGRVAVLSSHESQYCELPGGGVEAGEELTEALIRECLEEVGGEIEIISMIGCVREFRQRTLTVNETCGFGANFIGGKKPSVSGDAMVEGKEVKWLPIEGAISLIGSSSTAHDLYHRYAVERDQAFLREASSKLAH
jgi:8-oxo-dGTP diphosphatase